MSQSSVFSRQSSIKATAKIFFAATMICTAAWAVQVMSSEALRVRADHLRLNDERQTAERLYKAAAAIDPQNWRSDLGLAQVYSAYRFKESDPAQKKALVQIERDLFARAYRHNTKKEEIMYGLGRAEIAAGNIETGLDHLRQAANHKCFNDFYWRKLAIQLGKAGYYKEALDAFQNAHKLNRSNAFVKRNIKWLKAQLAEE